MVASPCALHAALDGIVWTRHAETQAGRVHRTRPVIRGRSNPGLAPRSDPLRNRRTPTRGRTDGRDREAGFRLIRHAFAQTGTYWRPLGLYHARHCQPALTCAALTAWAIARLPNSSKSLSRFDNPIFASLGTARKRKVGFQIKIVIPLLFQWLRTTTFSRPYGHRRFLAISALGRSGASLVRFARALLQGSARSGKRYQRRFEPA